MYEIKGHILKTQNSNKEPFEFQSKQYLNELLFLKKELAEIKDYLTNLNMQGKELPFIYHFRKQKEYLDIEFRNINMSIEKKTDTPDLLNSFKKGNVIIKRNIFFFLVIAVASILIVCILVLFYLLKNYKS